MSYFKLPIPRLRDITRSYDKTSYRILKRGPCWSGKGFYKAEISQGNCSAHHQNVLVPERTTPCCHWWFLQAWKPVGATILVSSGKKGTKSALLGRLPSMHQPGQNSESAKKASVVLLDIPAIVHMAKPQRGKVFGEYAEIQLRIFMASQVTPSYRRVNAVWDTYRMFSLKSHTRSKLLGDVPEFHPRYIYLREQNGRNSTRTIFFQFLSEQLQAKTAAANYYLFTTKADKVLRTGPLMLQSHLCVITRTMTHVLCSI